MFVVEQKISDVWTDHSCHTISEDADWQKAKLIASGVLEDDARITEKESYNPPNRL